MDCEERKPHENINRKAKSHLHYVWMQTDEIYAGVGQDIEYMGRPNR